MKNNLLNKLLIVLIVATISISCAYAANWYVDNSVSTSGNGQSWNTAWKSFPNIAWASVQPGDTVYISGGTSGQTYTDTLTIGKSGTSGNLITVIRGTDAGHNGNVMIDNSGGYCVVITQDYVKVSGLRVTGEGFDVDGATGSIVENNYIYFSEGRGVFIQNSDHIIVRNNYMETPSFVSAQTDGIYSQRNSLNSYEGNTIIVNNQETSGHDDCIQLYDDTSITVKGNYLEQNNDKSGNAQGLYATTMHGTTYYLNNVVNLRNAQSNGMSFRRLPELGGDGTVVMIGNTVYSIRAYHTAQITETDNPVVKNNIFFNDIAAPSFYVTGWAGDPSNIDNNLYFTGSANSAASFNGATKSWTAWKSLGFDAHGLFIDPKVVNIATQDFHLQATSPAIDKGASLGSPYNIDKDGVARPQGAAWDIGAYEYNTGSIQCDPADTNCDGCISLGEISAYVNLWLVGQVTLGDVSTAVNAWLQGC